MLPIHGGIPQTSEQFGRIVSYEYEEIMEWNIEYGISSMESQ